MTASLTKILGCALVTGGGVRIGRVIALELASLGYAVGVHYRRSAAEAMAVVEAIKAHKGHAVALQADLAREDETEGLMPKLANIFGPVTVLINNASEFTRDEVTNTTRYSWDLHMEANLRAPFVLTQALATALPTSATGSIINIVDQRVLALTPHFISYTVSKAALWTLTQTLALALAPNIRVNAIGPGPTLSSKTQTDAAFLAQCMNTPLQRGATPEEIAQTIGFLISQPSITGQLITVDGGQHLGWNFPGMPDAPEG